MSDSIVTISNTINYEFLSSWLSKLKIWSSDVSCWLNELDIEIEKIYLILNTYKINKKINFFDSEENIYNYIKDINSNIDLIDNWINKTLKSYDKIITDISNIQKILISIEIKYIETSYLYEYSEIIKRSMIFFKMLLAIIKEITNIKTYIAKVVEIIISNKKRKLEKEDIDNLDDKSDELLEITKYLDDEKYSKINVICTFNNIINYLQINNLCQELTKKMQTRIEKFLNFLNELNDKYVICIKKLNNSNIDDTCLGFHIIIIINKDEWIKAIEHNVEKKEFSACSIYEMLSMFGYSSQLYKKKSDLSYQHLDKRVKILYSRNIWFYNYDTFVANIHRSWNSNIAGVDTIWINNIQNKVDKGIDLILQASQI